MPFNITSKPVSIRENICSDGKTLVTKNIKYPHFEYNGENKKVSVLCGKMNRFYKDAGTQYDSYAQKTMAKKAKKQFSPSFKPWGAIMNYYVCYCDDDIISVVVDVSFFDGNVFFSNRISHTWSVSKSALLPPSYFIRQGSKVSKYVKSELLTQLRKNRENTSFEYFSDCEKQFLKHFRLNQFYFVPAGIAFYIDAGILSSVKNGPSVFIMDYAKADGFLKFCPVITNKERNLLQL